MYILKKCNVSKDIYFLALSKKEEVIQMIESPLKGLIKYNVFEGWFKLGEDQNDEKFEAELERICKVKLSKMNEFSDFFLNK